MADALSPLGQQVKQQDHDRYLTLIFAPADAREALFVLAAFNQELARTAERVSEPLLGEMRLAWWRDAVEAMAGGGKVPEHPVTEALTPLVAGGGLPAADLLAMIEARRRDLDPEGFATQNELLRYAGETAGTANRLTAQLLGLDGKAQEVARDIGTAWGILGQLRAYSAWRLNGKIWLPQSLLAEAGLTRGRLMEGVQGPDLAKLAQPLAKAAEDLLRSAERSVPSISKASAPPFLLGSLARGYLRRLAACRFDLADPSLALLPPERIFGLTWAVVRRRW